MSCWGIRQRQLKICATKESFDYACRARYIPNNGGSTCLCLLLRHRVFMARDSTFESFMIGFKKNLTGQAACQVWISLRRLYQAHCREHVFVVVELEGFESAFLGFGKFHGFQPLDILFRYNGLAEALQFFDDRLRIWLD